MKGTVIYSALFLVLAATTCRKIEQHSHPLVGEWQWISSANGFARLYETPAKTGKEAVLIFASDSTYRWLEADEERSGGTYRFEMGRSMFDHQETELLLMTGRLPQVYRIANDTLWLMDHVTDGYTHRFRRKQD